MSMRRALVVDAGEPFRDTLCKLLQADYLVTSCDDGQKAVQLLRKDTTDVLVLDLMLSGLDGISLLRSIKDEIRWPIVLALTSFPTPYVVNAAANLGVSYLMMKPCDPKTVAEHLNALVLSSEPPMFSQPDQRARISRILRALCVPTKRMGYSFLREAILLKIADPQKSMMKELYPAVGSIMGATVNQVERDIRGVISAAWKHRDAPAWAQLFPPEPDGTFSRPTNTEFIAGIAKFVASDQFGFEDDFGLIG